MVRLSFAVEKHKNVPHILFGEMFELNKMKIRSNNNHR